jgi:hypothetical protein
MIYSQIFHQKIYFPSEKNIFMYLFIYLFIYLYENFNISENYIIIVKQVQVL